jgi:hypothetical protein
MSSTMDRFHDCDSFVRALMGPIGSGKSVTCCMEIVKRAQEQAPWNGVRKSRWAIIRNTYRELVDTTINTFFDWFPKDKGIFRQMDMKWNFNYRHPDDGTLIELEIMFRALDRPDDIKKLLSLELTGGWINEAREVPKQVLDMLQGRVGRYPNKREGGPSWFGIIMDTNPPDSDHWWYKLFEEEHTEGFKLFKQPSGVSQYAENIENLPANYYKNMIAGKDQEWINVYVHGQYGFIADGKPVFPEYKDDIHAASDDLLLIGGTVYIGIDFGLTPAAVIGQITASGQLQIIDELVTEDMGAMNFGRLLNEKIQRDYCGCELQVYADPAGEQRSQTDEITPFQILWNQGIEAWPTYTNDFTVRREACADYMQRLDFGGKPAFIISPKAKMLRKALAGGYKYKRMQVSGEARFQDKPDKGRYSHVADAMQYMVLGAVGGDRVIGGYGKQKVDYSTTNRMVV